MSRPQPSPTAEPVLRRVLHHFGPEIRRQRRWIGTAVVALFAEVGLRVLEPWPLKFVFDRLLAPVLVSDTTATAATSLGSRVAAMSSTSLLTAAALAMLGIAGLRALAAYWNTVGFAIAGNRSLADVRSRLFRKLQYMSLAFHNRSRAGDLVIRVIGDISLLQDAAVTAFLPLLARLLILVGMVGTMFWMEWRLALLALALLPLFFLRTVRLSGELRSVARKQRRREGAMAATASESLSAARAVQALSLESTFSTAFGAANQKSQKEDVRGKRLAAALERSVDVFIAAASALVLWFGARFVLRGNLSPGDLLVFLAYLKTAFRPLQDFAKYTARLGKASAAADRILEVLDAVPEVADRPNAVPAPALQGSIEFERITFGHDPTLTHLEDISFRIPPGSRVAVIGASGSGKSTLVGLLLRLFEPRSGTLRLDGRDIHEFTVDSVRRQTGVVLQDTSVFAGTVRDNITLGSVDVTPDAVEAAARLANAHEFISALPQGYDTPVGERGVTLSQGQRQRIAIARAALRNAPILLLDEPISGLDAANAQAITESLIRLGAGRTTLWITHDLREARTADLILHLHEGRLIEAGTHDQLLQKGGSYAAQIRNSFHEGREHHALSV